MAEKKSSATKRKGRPKGSGLFTKAIAAVICERISKGETLASICRDLNLSRNTVNTWLLSHEDFHKQYTRARDVGFDAIAEDTLRIADEMNIVEEEVVGFSGEVSIKKRDATEHRKLQIETRKWLLSRWCPKRYGDKSSLEVTGKDGEAIKTETKSVVSMSNDELMKIALLKVDNEE